MVNRAQRRQAERKTPVPKIASIKPAKDYGGVVIAYPHPVDAVGARFHISLIDLVVKDAYTTRYVTGHATRG